MGSRRSSSGDAPWLDFRASPYFNLRRHARNTSP